MARVIQTLEDWGFINSQGSYVAINKIDLQNEQVAEWFIGALVTLSGPADISHLDLPLIPEKLGISFHKPQAIMQNSTDLVLNTSLSGVEIIVIKK